MQSQAVKQNDSVRCAKALGFRYALIPILHQVMKQQFPDLFAAYPEALFHMCTMISPQVLLDNNVKVHPCNSAAGVPIKLNE